ncbi:MAG: hypothetical protein QOE23_2514, partial [Pseudonocardiales bacterium]|nr:hypothetical protein [Pseudonocardiales bacterium]
MAPTGAQPADQRPANLSAAMLDDLLN